MILTQQRPAALEAALRDHGAIVEHVPLTEVAEPADGGAALLRELERLDRYDWLVVTSVNGARHVGAAARRNRGVRLAAVGEASADALEDVAGRSVDLVPARQRAEGLVAEFPPGPFTVLVAQGDLAGPGLVDGLRGQGHAVTAIEAYRTRSRQPTPTEAQLLRDADAIVLASGSAAAVLASIPAVSARLVAIGPTTDAAARTAGLRVASVAASPAADDVVAAVAAALHTA